MAAYRAAEKLQDLKTGETIDFSRKQGVIYSEIITPENAPEWAHNRQELWNRSEAAHRRGDAVIAREIQLSLPCELSDGQRQELTTNFARFMAEKYNVAVDMNLHAPNQEGDDRNYHAHLLICTRPFDETKPQGLGNNVRAFDAITHQKAATENHVELWRSTWAQQMNDALERADIRDTDGVTIKVDHRSYERQGVDQEPTIKEGTAATAKARRGEETERSQINDEIRQRNEDRAKLAEEIRADVQELDTLMRRQAELMAAHEIRETITPSKDPTETLVPREAKHLIAAELQSAPEVREVVTPSEDPTDTLTPRNAQHWIAPEVPQAAQVAAPEVQPPQEVSDAITPSEDPTETLAPREAKHLVASEVSRGLTAANDNKPDHPDYERLQSETEEKYWGRVERSLKRLKEPKAELNREPKGPRFGY